MWVQRSQHWIHLYSAEQVAFLSQLVNLDRSAEHEIPVLDAEKARTCKEVALGMSLPRPVAVLSGLISSAASC
jgi:uncharacterized protein YbbK (DUF523 family)